MSDTIHVISTANFSGFLFGDLRKNIPQIVGGLISKQIIVTSNYIADIYVGSKEESQNYAYVTIDLETMVSSFIGIKEAKVNSSIKRPLTYYYEENLTKKFINALNGKVKNEPTN